MSNNDRSRSIIVPAAPPATRRLCEVKLIVDIKGEDLHRLVDMQNLDIGTFTKFMEGAVGASQSGLWDQFNSGGAMPNLLEVDSKTKMPSADHIDACIMETIDAFNTYTNDKGEPAFAAKLAFAKETYPEGASVTCTQWIWDPRNNTWHLVHNSDLFVIKGETKLNMLPTEFSVDPKSEAGATVRVVITIGDEA